MPTVDCARFIVGTPDPELRDLARQVLGFAGRLDIRASYQSHGHALNELYAGLPQDAEVLVLEDDCYVTCGPDHIASIWERLPAVGGVMGSRMARMLEPDPPRFLDTFGRGLYPNMMFAQLSVLRSQTDLDFTSREGGDVGQLMGEQLHHKGIHATLEAHLPQCRLTGYCGTERVDPATWTGPWLHVGEMSNPTKWRPGQPRPGYFEASAALAAALATGEVLEGPAADKAKLFTTFTREHWPDHKELHDQFQDLMTRVFEGPQGR